MPGAGNRPAGAAGPAASPGPRGKQGRLAPGATAAPSPGVSLSPFERGKGRAGGGPRPGATAVPGEGAGRVSPSPFEGGKPPGRGHPGITPLTTQPREGLSPAPFEPRQRPRQTRRAISRTRCGRCSSWSRESYAAVSFPGCTTSPARRGRPPARRPGEEPNAGQGAPGQIPPQNRERGPERQRFGTPAPMGAGEHGQRAGGPSDQARGQKERMQAVHGQPPPQRGGIPAAAERGQAQAQPEGGKRKPEKGTPPPRPQ